MRKVFDNNCQQSMQGLSSMDRNMQIDSIFPIRRVSRSSIRSEHFTSRHMTTTEMFHFHQLSPCLQLSSVSPLSHCLSKCCGSRNGICISLICHSDCAPENQLKCQHSQAEQANRFILSKVDNSHSIHVFNWLNIRATAATLFWLPLKWNINRISYFTTSFEESGPFCLFQYLMFEDFEYYCQKIWCWVLITLQYTGRHEYE